MFMHVSCKIHNERHFCICQLRRNLASPPCAIIKMVSLLTVGRSLHLLSCDFFIIFYYF